MENKIEISILNLFKNKKQWGPVDLIEKLSKKYDRWNIRSTIWDLLSNDQLILTWKRKLKLGTYVK